MLPTAARVATRALKRDGVNLVRHSSTANVWLNGDTKVMVQGLTGKTVRGDPLDLGLLPGSLTKHPVLHRMCAGFLSH